PAAVGHRGGEPGVSEGDVPSRCHDGPGARGVGPAVADAAGRLPPRPGRADPVGRRTDEAVSGLPIWAGRFSEQVRRTTLDIPRCRARMVAGRDLADGEGDAMKPVEHLQALKQKLLHDIQLPPVWNYFMDHFGDHQEFMDLSENCEHPDLAATVGVL